MNPAKAAALLNGRVQSFSLNLGGDRLSDQDIAHAMAHIWHPGARLLGRVKWAGNDKLSLKLLSMVVTECNHLVVEQGWGQVNQAELIRVCKLAVNETVLPKLCPTCRGLGQFVVSQGKVGRPPKGAKPDLKIECTTCLGTGTIARSEWAMAKAAGLTPGRWRRVWSDRYHDAILPILDRYEAMFWAGMRRALQPIDAVNNLD